ncbi:PTS sugar transporter subunit IIB [Paenactinomyces guangxiensis]|uniref:PTS sugar transporter subunit IIB n=1 Tax=Paenactinomyces guangxiensis TaxID=1490290 RepID=A0A7W1WQ27_9BACL|nr:PTS sugar transporter subunit IIB [Paenactinomyces guangxiensis]MBA4493974.1 PTS sugar transporter subunit IIB [Paenactinomyces guangxiensis]MBH8593395.1 PTS sugar transporter subunit IIB [Paenactinomyces guangxiensis]
MKKIILACAAGMSTSIVVSKMKAEAQTRGEEYDIYAIPEGTIEEELAKCNGEDVLAILLGPQVRFMKKKAELAAAPYGIPVDVIDTKLYGTANGAKILDHALELAKLK